MTLPGTTFQPRHFFYSAAWQVIEERVNWGSVAQRQFVWGVGYIDELVLRERDSNSNGTLDERLYALQDANYNVTALADAAGAVVQRFSYDAYGQPEVLDAGWASAADAFDWEVRYAGYRYDAATGLYQVRFRYYHPGLGRWVSRDPIGYINGTSLYEYVNSAPLELLDPLGLYKCNWGKGFSDADKMRILDSFDRVKDLVDRRIDEIDDALNDLKNDDCDMNDTIDELERLKEVLQKISDGIASDEEELRFRENDWGNPDAPLRHVPRWGGFGTSNIEYNPNADTPWRDMTDFRLDQVHLHELSHEYGTVDDNSKGGMLNPHNFEALIDPSLRFNRWNEYRTAVLNERRRRGCD